MASTGISENFDSVSSTENTRKEIEELVERIRLERIKHNEYSIIKDVAFTYATGESGLSAEIKSKLYNILVDSEVEQCMKLPSNAALLGLSLNVPELSYEEKQQVKNAMERGIIEKSRKLFQELDELGIPTTTDNPHFSFGLNVKDEYLIGLKNELNRKQRLYVEKLEELCFILDEIVKLKSKTLPESANDTLHVSELKTELFSLRSQLIDAKQRIAIFTESAQSMDACRELLKDFHQQHTECEREIEKLKRLKDKYKLISGSKEYRDILENYMKYKAQLEIKKRMCSQLVR